LHQGTFPRSSVPSLAQAIVNQPVSTLARPLLVSAALRPGENVIVAAGDLPLAPPHDAMFILQGPNSRAQRLVQVSRGVAAGVVTIPASLSPGTWVLAAEDLSQLRAIAARRPSGPVYLDLAVVTETLTRLSEQGVTGTVLENEWAAIQQTGQEEAEYCHAAARLGLDPYSSAEPYEQDIMQVAETLSDELLTDFLNAVSPQHIGRALSWVSSGRSTVEKRLTEEDALSPAQGDAPEAGVVQELRAAHRGHASGVSAPWDVGYQQARIIRSEIAPDMTARLAVDRYVPSRTRQAPDVSLQALGASADEGRGALVIVGQRRPATSIRFTLSRALWHCIWDDSPLFIVTTAHTNRQRVERAFAAELLAPADGVAALLESPPEAASQEELEQIAQRFGVSSMVIEHQVRNHLIAA